jgi:hypothetical protein
MEGSKYPSDKTLSRYKLVSTITFQKTTLLLTSEAFFDSKLIGWEFSSHYYP